MIVNKLNDTQLFDIVKAAIDGCYLDLVWKFPEQRAYDAMINGVTDWLQEKLPLFDADNIKKAFENGILREYGDYHGLSKVTFVMFLKAYNVQIAAPKTNKDTTMIKSKPLLPEQFDVAKQNVHYAFILRKAGKDIQRAAGMNYDFLVSLGLCIYDKEVKAVIWREAIHFTIAQTESKKTSADLFARDAINKLIDTFNAGPDPESKEYNAIIINAKYLTICKYFDDIILTGINFSELVESKREVFYNLKSK